MTWILITFFMALIYFASNQHKIASRSLFRASWVFYSLPFIFNVLFTLIRAGNMRSSRDLDLIQVWSDGFTSLFLFISLLFLLNALVPSVSDKSDLKNSQEKEEILKLTRNQILDIFHSTGDAIDIAQKYMILESTVTYIKKGRIAPDASSPKQQQGD